MRKLGWILLAVAFLSAIAAQIVGRDQVWPLVFFGSAFVLGSILLATSAAIRLYRGEVKLRPWLAAKRMPIYFIVFLGVWLLCWAIFPSMEQDLYEALFVSGFASIFLSLDNTAYRKSV